MKSSRERHKEKAAALEREINNNELSLWLENTTHNSLRCTRTTDIINNNNRIRILYVENFFSFSRVKAKHRERLHL